MNEEQLIKKIKLLRVVQPMKLVLGDIKEGVYQQVGIEKQSKIRFNWVAFIRNLPMLVKEHTVISYSLAFVSLLIIFLSAYTIFLPNQFRAAILYGRLTLASNQYQKAQIAFADTKSRFAKDRPIGQNGLELSQSITLTNTQLDNLKLKGEKGKYTAQQCHQIYQEYLVYLESEQKNLAANNNPLFTQIRFQINTYEEQAERKLHMYNSM